MKERPILFSAPMVRAILEGRKTQTRRAINQQPIIDPQTGDWIISTVSGEEVWPIERWTKARATFCKYGKPGNRLYVRETWRPTSHRFPTGWPYEYRATAAHDGTPTDGNWKPSLFMPREASRIILDIIDVRVERLNDISEQDAKAEGVSNASSFYGIGANDEMVNRYAFRELWEKINGAGSWDKNPYVWVIEFKHNKQTV